MKRFIYCMIILSFSLLSFISCDKSIQTISFNPCNEKASNSIFQITDCQYFTRYTSSINIAGGGNFSQELKIVGNPGGTTLNIDSNGNVGALSCPPGQSCSTLEPPVTIKFVRSPLPSGMQTILPGSNISFGLAFPLALLSQQSGTGIPYSYEVFVSTLGCESFSSSVPCTNPFFQYAQDFNQVQPSCGATPLPTASQLLGTCGNLADNPTGYLSDGFGTSCYELCCCSGSNLTSVKIRSLSPKCWMFQAGNPTIVTDIGILIESAQIPAGLNPLLIPLYAQVSANSNPIINSSYPYARAMIQGIKDTTKYTSAFSNKVASGRFMFCSDEPTAFQGIPNEDTPVSNMLNLKWWYLPQPYQSFYYQGQQGGTSADQTLNKGLDPHVNSYGQSAQTLMQNTNAYLSTLYNTSVSVNSCLNLQGVIPTIPGYDTDNPIEPGNPFNTPSPCNMLNSVRSENLLFMPPGTVIPSQTGFGKLNWMLHIIDGILYAIYFPTDPSLYPQTLTEDFITVATDFATPIVTNYSSVGTPVAIVQDPPPICVFQNPKTGNTSSIFGGGLLGFQLVGTGLLNADDIGYDISPIYVDISCSGAIGKRGVNATVDIFNQTLPIVISNGLGQGQKSSDYTIFLEASYSNNKPYSKNVYQQMLIGNCTFTITYDASNKTVTAFVPCVSQNDQGSSVLKQCNYCDFTCQYLPKSWCFWIVIIAVITLVIIVIVSIANCSSFSKKKENKRDPNQTFVSAAQQHKISKQTGHT